MEDPTKHQLDFLLRERGTGPEGPQARQVELPYILGSNIHFFNASHFSADVPIRVVDQLLESRSTDLATREEHHLKDSPIPYQTFQCDCGSSCAEWSHHTTPSDTIYRSLPNKSSFRILEIHPSPAYTDNITCTLHLSSLPGAVNSYAALSYTWASSTLASCLKSDVTEPPRPISCNGHTVHVGNNLFDAISRIRDAQASRYIWADAICINQQDVAERSAQVAMMRDIYHSAHEVVIWLGEDEVSAALRSEDPTGERVAVQDGIDARAVFADLCMVVNLWRRGGLDSESDGQEPSKLPTTSTIPEAKFDAPAIKPGHARPGYHSRAASRLYWWQNTLKLFSRRWFHRVWVIQEVALARNATVLLGDCSISWEVIGLAAAILRNNFNRITAGVEQWHARQELLSLRTGVINAYFMYRLSRSQLYTKPIEVDFHDLLILTRAFDCEDDRDRIYGLLGLPFSHHGRTSSTEAMGSEPFIMPDYSKAASQVYGVVSEKLIIESGTVALLSSVQRPGSTFTLQSPQKPFDRDAPSWVPQWNLSQTQSLASFQKNLKSRSQQPNSVNAKIIPSQLDPLKKSLVAQVKDADTPRISLISSVCRFAQYEFYIPYWYLEDGESSREEPIGQGILPDEILLRGLTPENLTEMAMILTAGKDWHGAPILETDEATHMADFASFLIQGGLLWILDEKEAFGRVYTDPRPDAWEGDWGYSSREEFWPEEVGEGGEQLWTRDNHRYTWRKMVTDEQLERVRGVLKGIVAKEAEKGYEPNAMRFLDAAGTVGVERRRFTTEDGRRGIGPAVMRVGDVLRWVMDGSGDGRAYPYVLRRRGGGGEGRECFEVVGECYVYPGVGANCEGAQDGTRWIELV